MMDWDPLALPSGSELVLFVLFDFWDPLALSLGSALVLIGMLGLLGPSRTFFRFAFFICNSEAL